MEYVKKIINYTVGAQGVLICMAKGPHITLQVWLSIVNTNYYNFLCIFYMPHASGYKGQEINMVSFVNLPFCEI